MHIIKQLIKRRVVLMKCFVIKGRALFFVILTAVCLCVGVGTLNSKSVFYHEGVIKKNERYAKRAFFRNVAD